MSSLAIIIPLSTDLSFLSQKDTETTRSGVINITTNECRVDETRTYLEGATPIALPSCHIGCSSWHNFDIMILRKPSYGIFFDAHPPVVAFLEKTISALKIFTLRETFALAMCHYVKKTQTQYIYWVNSEDEDVGSPKEEIQSLLDKPDSFLGSDANYHYLRELALEGRLVAIREDFRDSEVFLKIKSLLRSRCLFVDTLYISNVFDWMHAISDKMAYIDTFKALCDPKTHVIRANAIRSGDEVTLPQTAGAPESLLKHLEEQAGLQESQIDEVD
jgi:hypothetical protein